MNDLAISTYFDPGAGPLPFCPGCGHDALLKALDKALVKLQRPANGMVIVTDIGCIGLSDRYFTTNAFHGLHGRSVTYACGLKLARPELDVIVLMGDGGCGIGGTHLLNAARRNVGVTVIVANNFNYGMTGGQHSVSTPTDGRTATTPGGNLEGPMDICGTLAAAGAAHAYRGTVYDRDLPDRIVEAVDRPGFSFLDIWELCTAYYVPRNQFRKKDVFDLVERTGFKLGVVADAPRPEYGERYRQTAGGAPKPRPRQEIDIELDGSLDRRIGIVIAGSAGGKIKSTATVFAKAALSCGLHATQKDDYPITVMTGHSVAEINLSPAPIDYTAIDRPDYFLVLTEDGLNRSRKRIANLPPDGTVIAEETLNLPPTEATVLRLPLASTARKINRTTLTTVALGALMAFAGPFPDDAFRNAINRHQEPSVAEVNGKALEAGIALVRSTADAV